MKVWAWIILINDFSWHVQCGFLAFLDNLRIRRTHDIDVTRQHRDEFTGSGFNVVIVLLFEDIVLDKCGVVSMHGSLVNAQLQYLSMRRGPLGIA